MSVSVPMNEIRVGDCISGMQSLPDNSIDLAFADPPFNIGYEYDVYHDRQGDREYLDWSKQWLTGVKRLLKPHGTLWIAIGDEYAAELKVLATRQLGLICRNWIIWYYTFGMNCRTKFSRPHPHLLYLVRNPKRFTFNASDPAVRVPSGRQRDGDGRAHPDGRIPDDTWILRPSDVDGLFSQNDDTWHIPRVNGTFRERQGWHGCQMPEQLLGRIIRACSNPGDIVLDPFLGSGTTAVVARKLARRFLGFELSPEYAANAKRRVASVHEGDPLAGGKLSVSTASTAQDDPRQLRLL